MIIRTWSNDRDYLLAQDTDSSWSHNTAFGECAALKFMDYGDALKRVGQLYHDDVVADFGGNDGFAANQFFLRHGIKPIVLDCDEKRLAYAEHEYGLRTIKCFIEDIPLPDDAIDWGFCSHVLEHARDPERALKEIARVVKRGCAFLLPLESHAQASANPAHSIYFSSVAGWRKLIAAAWVVKGSARTDTRGEAQIFAFPRNGHGRSKCA